MTCRLALMFYRLAELVDGATFDKEWEHHFIVTGEYLPKKSFRSRVGFKLVTLLHNIGDWLWRPHG